MIKLKLKDETMNHRIATELNKRVIGKLNQDYNSDIFMNLPVVVNTNTFKFHDTLIGDISIFENNYLSFFYV